MTRELDRVVEVNNFLFQKIADHELHHNPSNINWIAQLELFNQETGLDITPDELITEASDAARTWDGKNQKLYDIQSSIAWEIHRQFNPGSQEQMNQIIDN